MAFGRRKKAQASEGSGSEDGQIVLHDDQGRTWVAQLPSEGGVSASDRGEDSVDEQFGKTYPSDILDEIRTLQHPPWQESDSSLDPIEDIEAYAVHNFRMDPAAYDAIQATAAAEIEQLEAMRAPVKEEFKELVEQRKQLVEVRGMKRGEGERQGGAQRMGGDAGWHAPGWWRHAHHSCQPTAPRGLGAHSDPPPPHPVPPIPTPHPLIRHTQGRTIEDVKWLKLHAYHRGMQTLRAMDAEAATGPEREQYLASKGAPLDVVPQPLLDMTPGQWVERAESRGAQRGGGGVGGEGEEASSSEWEVGWDAPTWQRSPLMLAALSNALAGALGGSGSGAQAGTASQAASSKRDAADSGGGAMAVAAAGRPTAPQSVYTVAHQERLRRRRAVTSAARERKQAFWLGFAATAGVSTARWLWRRHKGAHGGAGGGAAWAGVT